MCHLGLDNPNLVRELRVPVHQRYKDGLLIWDKRFCGRNYVRVTEACPVTVVCCLISMFCPVKLLFNDARKNERHIHYTFPSHLSSYLQIS
jgi:hypothetical protein